ncbi:MAG: 50S ribosomal protein L13 [Clostridiales bacterium]|nr:50S ribosomal protein L13 [Clostridiales bacterium]
MRTTYIAKTADIQRKWLVIDATDKTLGRLASEIASILKGKKKPIYTPFIDTGDYVIVVNAEKIAVTGKKLTDKIYRRHSGWVGGMKETTLAEMMEKKPEEVIRLAVKGMLPKNTLGKHMLKKLHVYAGPDHKHEAQKPEVYNYEG